MIVDIRSPSLGLTPRYLDDVCYIIKVEFGTWSMKGEVSTLKEQRGVKVTCNQKSLVKITLFPWLWVRTRIAKDGTVFFFHSCFSMLSRMVRLIGYLKIALNSFYFNPHSILVYYPLCKRLKKLQKIICNKSHIKFSWTLNKLFFISFVWTISWNNG